MYIHSLLYSVCVPSKFVTNYIALILLFIFSRLVLLLQAMAKYLDGMLNFGRGVTSANTGPGNSIGLVVKKYWNKMVHLYTVLQQLQSEVRSKQNLPVLS